MAYEFKLPDIGEGVVEGEIISWRVKPGDEVEEDDPMVEVMTDKATVEIPSPVKGRILECIGDEGDVVEVGATLVVIEPSEKRKASGKRKKEEAPKEKDRASGRQKEKPAPAEKEAADERVLATPAVRRLARERKIEMEQVEGTGPGGRITREDLDRFAAKGPPQAEAPSERPEKEVETIPYRGLRKKIGDRLSQAKHHAPHYTYVEEVDMTALVELRRQYLKRRSDGRLTYLPFILKALVAGLKKFPLLNATLDEEAGQILVKRYYNIGVATATEEGLIVPVVKGADRKGIVELSEEIHGMAEAARQGKTRLEDLKDGTFTVTSLGALGGLMATPIINYPEVAILGIHRIQEKPVVRHGTIATRHIMNLSLSLDHRVVDGAVAAQFMHEIIPLLESPALLWVE